MISADYSMTFLEDPHRRKNILSGEWVLNSPQRTKRPWNGSIHSPEGKKRASYDSQCYLCPGNSRAEGEQNPDYKGIFVFANDFPSLLKKNSNPNLDEDAKLWRRPSFKIGT